MAIHIVGINERWIDSRALDDSSLRRKIAHWKQTVAVSPCERALSRVMITSCASIPSCSFSLWRSSRRRSLSCHQSRHASSVSPLTVFHTCLSSSLPNAVPASPRERRLQGTPAPLQILRPVGQRIHQPRNLPIYFRSIRPRSAAATSLRRPPRASAATSLSTRQMLRAASLHSESKPTSAHRQPPCASRASASVHAPSAAQHPATHLALTGQALCAEAPVRAPLPPPAPWPRRSQKLASATR